jgi:hypothetical protein
MPAVAVALTGLLAAGCTSPGEPMGAGDDGWRVIDEQATWPDLDSLASPVWLATDDDALATGWTRFGLDGEPPAIDFDEVVALLIDNPDQEDCPREPTGVEVVDGPAMAVPPNVDEPVPGPDRYLHVEVLRPADHEEPCRGGPAPSVLVLAVDRAPLEGEPFAVRVGGLHDGAAAFSVHALDQPPALAPHADHDLRLEPASVPAGETVTAHVELGPEVEARGDEDHHLARPTGDVDAELARWDGHQWVAVRDEPPVEPATEREVVARLDTAGLDPGTYRLRLQLEVDGDEFASAQRPTATLEVVEG